MFLLFYHNKFHNEDENRVKGRLLFDVVFILWTRLLIRFYIRYIR